VDKLPPRVAIAISIWDPETVIFFLESLCRDLPPSPASLN
jgi:hypothetical protein